MKKSFVLVATFVSLFFLASLTTSCAGDCVPSTEEIEACDGEYDYQTCTCHE